MNHLKKAIKILANFFTGILLALLILVIYGKIITTFSENKYPNYFGYTFFEVVSGSMEPTLNINDVILIKITNQDLQKDDIIAFVNEKSIITHRLVYQEGDTLTVKGDSNNTIDRPIKRNQVIGKVIKILPKFGIWKKVITDPKVIIFIFITLLLFDYALSYNNKDSKNKKSLKSKENNNTIEIKKIELPEEKNEELSKADTNSPPAQKEDEKLLELTRKINIEEINKLLEGSHLELNKQELKNVKQEIKRIENKKEEPNQELTQKEKEFINYTIRLDLSEIQKKINERIR